jgi:alkaline phosphatase
MKSMKYAIAALCMGSAFAAQRAHAAPSAVSITPPGGARFLVDQRFDLRVEGKGTGPFSAKLAIDGVPQTFSSGAQNSTATDGISAAGFGGFNLRGYSSSEPGVHTLRATFSDATGTVSVESKFEVIDAFGRREPVKNVIIFLGDGMGTAHRTAARLMVEGAHIDKQSHAMDAERAIGDTLEFDRAIAVARDFAEKIDRRTVVIVLADHECSGFSIIGALNTTIAKLQALPPDGAVLDPNTQPARQAAVGTYDAAGFPAYQILADGYPATFDIDGKLLFGFGASGDRYETWQTRPRPIVDSLLPSDIRGELSGADYPGQPFNRDQSAGVFLRGQAVGKDQAVHTAADIPVSAYSPRAAVAQQFVGVQRNTDVFFKLARAVLGGY